MTATFAPSSLHRDIGFLVESAVILRGPAFAGLESAVEIREVVETAGLADIRNLLIGVQQLAGGILELQIYVESGDRNPHLLPEYTAERSGAHSDKL